MRIDNYYTDRRVMAGESADWFLELDEARMKALIHDSEIDEEVWVDFYYGVCPTCNGKGSHVNPSIDCDGISSEQFYEDPEFADDYFNGGYDVPCYDCKGKRVVPVCDDKRVIAAMEAEADYQAECAAERRMGA